jgi:putative tryptophan/tyrosine transport system substrate-binding protein
MQRREFVTILGGAAAAWPRAARSQQQPALPVIGFLSGQSPAEYESRLTAFRQGLNESGFVEHRNVGIEYRWAQGRPDRLPGFAADLVHRQVSVIVATAGAAPALAAKAATTAIPIVFNTGGDPVKLGLVSSFNRPNGNVTGVAYLNNELAAKRFELLHELVPAAAEIGVLINPTNPNSPPEMSDVLAAARVLGLRLLVENASSERDIDAAFASFVRQRVNALFVAGDAFFNARRDQLAALAARHALPASYGGRDNVAAGGLMSYSPSGTGAYRQAGVYTGRILKGDKPADLPVQRTTKIELLINLQDRQSTRPYHPGNAAGHR